MSGAKAPATRDSAADRDDACALQLRRRQLDAQIAKLEGEIDELALLIRNIALTDRDTSDLQDDLHRRMDDLAEAIEQRIRLLTDEQRD